uniref:Uncharacterized protein n=1 Tax=Oryza punctata TaxID=4537 RepID=A0A0E0L5C4_ORYPU
MGWEAPSPPVRDAGSSSGQKRKAFTMDQDGSSEDTWLKLSLGPVVYADATNVDDSSVTATSPKELPAPAVVQQTVGPPSVPAAHDDDALPPIFVASATTSLVINHGINKAARMATGVLFNGDARGSVPNPTPVDWRWQMFLSQYIRMLASAILHLIQYYHLLGSSSLHLQRHHKSSSARHLPRPTQRRSTASTTSSSDSAGDAPAITGDGANGGNDDGNGAAGTVNGRVLMNPAYPWATNRVAVHHSLVELSRRGINQHRR